MRPRSKRPALYLQEGGVQHLPPPTATPLTPTPGPPSTDPPALLLFCLSLCTEGGLLGLEGEGASPGRSVQGLQPRSTLSAFLRKFPAVSLLPASPRPLSAPLPGLSPFSSSRQKVKAVCWARSWEDPSGSAGRREGHPVLSFQPQPPTVPRMLWTGLASPRPAPLDLTEVPPPSVGACLLTPSTPSSSLPAQWPPPPASAPTADLSPHQTLPLLPCTCHPSSLSPPSGLWRPVTPLFGCDPTPLLPLQAAGPMAPSWGALWNAGAHLVLSQNFHFPTTESVPLCLLTQALS